MHALSELPYHRTQGRLWAEVKATLSDLPFLEAKAEAERIVGLNRFHAEVFVVRWQIEARMGDWEAARDMARGFTQMFPERPSGWLCHSYSLYKLNRPLDAYLELLHQGEVFPKVNAFPYFLACYSWELGDAKGTGKWLGQYKALGGNLKIKPTFWDQPELLLHWDQVHSNSCAPSPCRQPGPNTPT